MPSRFLLALGAAVVGYAAWRLVASGADRFRRASYFVGRLLGSDALTREQEYHRDRRQRDEAPRPLEDRQPSDG